MNDSNISQVKVKIDNFRIDPWSLLSLNNLSRSLDFFDMGAIFDRLPPGDFQYHVYVKSLLLN